MVDGFYNRQLKFEKGKIYDIPTELGEAARWLKRGAVEVIEEVVIVEPITPVVEEVTVVEKEEVVVVEEEVIVEEAVAEELPVEEVVVEESIVNVESKKENVRGKKRKEKVLNETSEVL
jgi:hypothetical protein